MATRYWVGGGSSANWDATGNTNWGTASNTRDNASVPTSSDDVIYDNSAFGNTASTWNVANAACKSLTMTAYTNTITHSASANMNVSGSIVFGSGMTYSPASFSSNIKVIATGSCTFAGKALASLIFDGVGQTFTMLDSVNFGGSATRGVNFINGTLKVDGATDNAGFTHAAGLFTAPSNTKTLTLGNCTLNLSGPFNATNIAFDIGVNTTVTANTATVNVTGAGGQIRGGGKTYGGTVNITGSGICIIDGANTFANLNRTGTNAKTDGLLLVNNQTVTGVLTLAGNSSINRLLVQAGSVFSSQTPLVGTSRTITNTGATMTISNTDFMDITMATAWDASARTDIGDANGNSGITFPASVAQTWNGASGGNWSTNAWTTRVPLPQDPVSLGVAFSASQTVVHDMPRLCKNYSWSGATGSPVASFASTPNTIYGSVDMTGVGSISGTQVLTLAGR